MKEGTISGGKSMISHKAAVLNRPHTATFTFTFHSDILEDSGLLRCNTQVPKILKEYSAFFVKVQKLQGDSFKVSGTTKQVT
jgi:hypothetical protein